MPENVIEKNKQKPSVANTQVPNAAQRKDPFKNIPSLPDYKSRTTTTTTLRYQL